MRIHLIKLTITLSLGILFTIYSLNGSSVSAFSGGPPTGNTGAPGESYLRILSFRPRADRRKCFHIRFASELFPQSGDHTDRHRIANESPSIRISLTALDDSDNRAGDLMTNDARTLVSIGRTSIYQPQCSSFNPVSRVREVGHSSGELQRRVLDA